MGNTVESGIKLTRAQVTVIRRAIRALKTALHVLQDIIDTLESCLPQK